MDKREIVSRAREIASNMKHNYLGTEHILAAIHEDSAVTDLTNLTLIQIEQEIVYYIGMGENLLGRLTLTRRAEDLLYAAYKLQEPDMSYSVAVLKVLERQPTQFGECMAYMILQNHGYLEDPDGEDSNNE